MASRVASNSWGALVDVCSRNHNAQGLAALSIGKDGLRLAPALPRSVGLGLNQVPPKRALPMAPSAARPWSQVHAIQLVRMERALHQGSKRARCQGGPSPPTVERCERMACRTPSTFRQSVPIGRPLGRSRNDGMHVEHLAWVDSRLRPRALVSGSSSRMIGSNGRPKLVQGASQMVSSVSCFPMRSLPMLLEKPYESS